MWDYWIWGREGVGSGVNRVSRDLYLLLLQTGVLIGVMLISVSGGGRGKYRRGVGRWNGLFEGIGGGRCSMSEGLGRVVEMRAALFSLALWNLRKR